MPLMKSKGSVGWKRWWQFKNPDWSPGRVSHWAALHVQHSWEEHTAAVFFWAGRELTLTKIPFSWKIFRKGFAFSSITSWFKQDSLGLQWGLHTDFLLRCLGVKPWVGRMLSNGWLKVWHLTELKVLIGPGGILNIFKYPHKSKNMTFCNWNYKMRGRFCSFGGNLNMKEISYEWILKNAFKHLSNQSTL